MKKLIPLLSIVLFAFIGMAMVNSTSEEITVEGKLIDTKCFGMMPEMNITDTHKVPGKDGKMMEMSGCGTACASMGIPVGIVEGGEPGGKTYVIIASANALKEHMAKEARVTGEQVFAGGIIASKVEVKEDGKWVDVTPGAMM